MLSRLTFCGRDSQLEELITRWHLASDVENPSPQIVVIKAERGLGKTRLALEFYRWLSTQVDDLDQKCYWPDALGIVDKNLEVNPDSNNCNFDVPIPYLWWGLRAGDPGSENGVAGDSIATYDRYLGPQLVALLWRARAKDRAWEVFKAVGETGLDLAFSALHVDDIISVAKGVNKIAQILSGVLSGNVDEPALNEAMEASVSRSAAALQAMEKIFTPKTITYAKVAGVIFLDDAQFAHKDAALPTFIENLMYTAVINRWPMLVLVTHWKTELSPELMTNGRSFAGILSHAREDSSTYKGPSAAVPAGYLTDEHYSEIDLKPIGDLSVAICDKLPGLSEEQSSTILAQVGGNPRFLEQVIEFLLENERFFEGSDPSRPLTTEGLEEALNATKSQEIFKIVLRRLRQAPEGVQEAICLASLQGVRFANDLVDSVAHSCVGHSVREALRKAEDPYSMLIGTKTVGQPLGQFAERLFYEVAKQQRLSLPSLGGEAAVQTNFRETVAAMIDAPDYATPHSIEARLLVYGVGANLFEHSSQPNERWVAQKALGEVARLELSRFSLESAAAAYERLLAIEPHSHSLAEGRKRIETWSVLATIYRNLSWPAKSARAFRKIFWEAASGIPDGFNIFLRSTDADAAREWFNRWKQEHADWPSDVYMLVVQEMVFALLNLSELARARPDLRIEEGDDPLGDTPFLVRSERRLENTLDDEVPEHVLQAMFLMERAYAQNGVLGAGEVERRHFRLLEDLAKTADRGGDLSAAESFLLRALEINRDRRDELDQITTLSNLGMVAGKRGSSEASRIYLDEARGLVESILTEDTFVANFVVDEEGDRHRAKPRKVGSVSIPMRYSAEFDEDSEAVLHKVRTLKQLSANIYGNLAARAQQDGRLTPAKEAFLRALTIHTQIGDKKNITIDLRNLGKIAHVEGDLVSACSYWSKCVEIFRELEQRDAGKITERSWTAAIEAMLEEMRASGCSSP